MNETFFNELICLNKYERLKKISELTINFEIQLLVELINSFTEYTIDKLHNINDNLTNLPIQKPILQKGEIAFSILNFQFYEIREMELNKFEVYSNSIEIFYNKFNFETVQLSFKYTDILEELGFLLNQKILVKSYHSEDNEETILNDNPYPLIFLNNKIYNSFIHYTENHIINFYIDYSYLKKRLEHEKLIHKQTDKDFFYFLKNDLKKVNYINEETFNNSDSKFISLGKCTSEQRENNFNIIFSEFLK